MDVRSGRVLFAKSADLRWSPASTTKILTAMLAMDALSEETLIRISERASVERSGSAIGLEPGEQWKARDLLYAMLLHSANDAAVAHYGYVLESGRLVLEGPAQELLENPNVQELYLGMTREPTAKGYKRYKTKRRWA